MGRNKAPSTIYAIRCTVNGKVYIGRTQDITRRMKEHLNVLKKGEKDICRRTDCGFQSDFDRYGIEAFKLHILESHVAPENVRERESYWINHYSATDRRFGYNLATEKVISGFDVVEGVPPVISQGQM